MDPKPFETSFGSSASMLETCVEVCIREHYFDWHTNHTGKNHTEREWFEKCSLTHAFLWKLVTFLFLPWRVRLNAFLKIPACGTPLSYLSSQKRSQILIPPLFVNEKCTTLLWLQQLFRVQCISKEIYGQTLHHSEVLREFCCLEFLFLMHGHINGTLQYHVQL